jgi:hypothetical protein
VEPKVHDKGSGALKNDGQVTIFVHSKHTRHQPGSDADSFFLPVHPEVISCARSVARASERDEQLIRDKVGALERVTHRFHIIQKEVDQLAYDMRINGTLCQTLSDFLIILCIMYKHSLLNVGHS